MSTELQKNLAQNIAENSNRTKPKSKKELIVSSGYSQSSAEASPHVIMEQIGVIEELKKLGFHSDNAKRVVGEILNKDYAEDRDRLSAAKLTFQVMGEMAPEKVVYINLEPKPTKAIQELANGLLNKQRE